MRLNLLNQTVIVSTAILQAGLTNLNPRFGVAHRVNDKTFKYADTGDVLNAVLVERVDLGELFATIPQDITGFEFQDSPDAPVELKANQSIDLMTQVYPVISETPEPSRSDDTLALFFDQWKRVVGISDLNRYEVDLSSSGDYLIIDARNAVLFKGSVQVKIK